MKQRVKNDKSSIRYFYINTIYFYDHKNYCIDYKHDSKVIYRIETGEYKASNAIQALSKIVFPIGATKNGTVKSTPFEK